MLKKKEIIWREIFYQANEKNRHNFTQQEIARKYGFSLSTVFNALKVLRASGAVVSHGRGFRVSDQEKLLYLWGTFRQLSRDVIYQAYSPDGVLEIEGNMPPGVVFGAFSAYTRKHGEAPADYDRVYVYLEKDQLAELRRRFPGNQKAANIIVLEADPWLREYGPLTPDGQTFADLWSLPEWYAKEFLNALKEKILDYV